MEDKKRLIGEEVPEITQGAIDAWNRGKGDAEASKRLEEQRAVDNKKAVKIVKMYAELGDIHYCSTKFDLSPAEVRKVLAAFSINSIEDAKEIVRNGIIAELDDAVAANREEQAANATTDQAEAQQRLDEHQATLEPEAKTTEEIDTTLAKRRDEAQRKNKEDHLRLLLSEGIDPKTGTSGFRVPLARISQFKRAIPAGVSHLQREFGGTSADIVGEVKRLAPEYDVAMLRP